METTTEYKVFTPTNGDLKTQPFFKTIFKHELIAIGSVVKYFEANCPRYSIRELANYFIMEIEDKYRLEMLRLAGNNYPYGAQVNTFATFCIGSMTADITHRCFIRKFKRLVKLSEDKSTVEWYCYETIKNIASKSFNYLNEKPIKASVFKYQTRDYIDGCYRGEFAIMQPQNGNPVCSPAFKVAYIVIKYFKDIINNPDNYETWFKYLKANTAVDITNDDDVYELSKEIESGLDRICRRIAKEAFEANAVDLPIDK